VQRLLNHLRSQAIGYLALFVALGGTAYAVSLPPDSVGTAQLKSSAVTTDKLKRDSVTSARVKDSTLRAQDFAPGVLTGGGTGPQGPPGPPGPPGGSDSTILWAVVQAGDGVKAPAIERGKGAVSVTRLGAGVHEVKFDRDVSNCAYEATTGGAAPIYSPGLGPPTAITVNPKSSAPDTVIVGISDTSGGSTAALDASFHLLVAC
jgi:hypothetical protein